MSFPPSLQSELLAALFKDELSTAVCLFAGGGPGANDASEQQPPVLTERVPMVGSEGLKMEPTKELNLEDSLLSPPPPSPVTVDTNFCDSLLNSVPDAVCKSEVGPHDPPALNMECVSLYDSCNMDIVMPNFDSLDLDDLDSLDLECFLSAPVPLAC